MVTTVVDIKEEVEMMVMEDVVGVMEDVVVGELQEYVLVSETQVTFCLNGFAQFSPVSSEQTLSKS